MGLKMQRFIAIIIVSQCFVYIIHRLEDQQWVYKQAEMILKKL